MMLDILEYYRMMMERDINIIYCGPLCSDGIECIGGTLKKRLEQDALPLSAAQAVFSVFVEQMNNMLMYSAEKEELDIGDGGTASTSKGIFVLGKQGGEYFIQTANMMNPNLP